MIKRILGLACALVASAASAQTAIIYYIDDTGKRVAVTPSTPLPGSLPATVPATSTPLAGSVTPTTATPTSGAASIAAGTARIGPLDPNLNRPVRVTLTGTWSGSFSLGTSTNACATIMPLTVGGVSWGSFSGNANEPVDVASAAGVSYCASATITSGTLNYQVRQ